MLSGHTQNASQVDEPRTIQVQGRRSCATYGSAALNFQEVIVPCEVPRPSLATWVEQRDSSPGERIARLRLGIFVTITRRARQSHFGHRMPRATRPGQNMLADEGGARVICRMPAVLATIAGTVAHLPP
jgi:hypothetical protein